MEEPLHADLSEAELELETRELFDIEGITYQVPPTIGSKTKLHLGTDEDYTYKVLLFKTGIIPQARQTVASMLTGYQVNKVDFLNLLRSQITLFNYETQYWKALTEANQALAQLSAVVGKDDIYE